MDREPDGFFDYTAILIAFALGIVFPYAIGLTVLLKTEWDVFKIVYFGVFFVCLAYIIGRARTWLRESE